MNRAPNFNRLAGLYRWMEYFTFGPWLSRARFAFLGDLRSCRNAVVFGDGDGRFTARLLRSNPTIHIDAVDASSAMLQALLHRAGEDAVRIRTHLADARSWEPANAPHERELSEGASYELIVTHFFLDCLTTDEVQSLAATLRGAAAPSALWVVSDFAVPKGWFGWLIAGPVVWSLYQAFGWLTGLAIRRLPDHRSALCQAGFTLQICRPWLGGLLVSELWSASPVKIKL